MFRFSMDAGELILGGFCEAGVDACPSGMGASSVIKFFMNAGDLTLGGFC
jgi:hypothetical protein